MADGVRRLTGYCTRCGGDCFDNGNRNYHKCPTVRPEAAAVVALKFACDNFRNIVERRAWTAIIRKEDCGDVLKAADQLEAALRAAFP